MASSIKKTALAGLSAALGGLALLSCGNNEENVRRPSPDPSSDAAAGGMAEPLAAPGWTVAASAGFVNRNGGEAGHAVLFDAPSGGVLIRIRLAGLGAGPPGSGAGWRAVHLHEVGDCSDAEDGFLAAGGHVNPDGIGHGLLNPDGPARADLPNIHAGPDGRATAEMFNARIALAPGEAALAAGAHPIMDEDGFAIVVHDAPDDHMTQPIGGAGARIACAAFREQ